MTLGRVSIAPLRFCSTATSIAATLALSLLAACSTTPASRTRAHGTTPAAGGTATSAAGAQVAAAGDQVASTERAFAQTLANRDLKAFVSFLSEDAIFFSGSNVEHGPAEIAEVWAPFFAASRAPFTWHPDHVEVTPDGQLALSTGPILQEDKVVGRFNSIWRLENGNTWRIVFDKGEALCGPPTERHVTRGPN
jgi:ketosteroid isomerase-like protein